MGSKGNMLRAAQSKYEWINNMKKLFENWNNYLNERGNPSERRFREAVVDFVTGQMEVMGMNPGEPADRARIQKDTHGIVDLAIEQLGLAQEAMYEPGRAVADIDTGEERMSPEELMRDEVQDLADKFNVEASVEIASDGKPAILVTHRNGETTVYNDTREMYRDLSDEVGRRDFGDPDKYEDEYEMYEGAVPHSAQHVVNKMKKTGLSAKEALKSLTTDLSDEEAERWLKRHKDEMDSAKKGNE